MYINPVFYGVVMTLVVEFVLVIILGWLGSKNDLEEFDNYDE